MKPHVYGTVAALVMVSSLAALAQSTTGSFRKDLQITQALVQMSNPKPVVIDGLRASFSYSFTIRDMTGKHAGSASFNLVLGSRDGERMTMFTLMHDGPSQEPGFATFGQVVGHLGRHCLGVPEDVLRAVGTDFGKLFEQSASANGKAQAISKSYGSIVLVGQNVSLSQTNFKYVFYLANTATPGMTGRKTTCAVKV